MINQHHIIKKQIINIELDSQDLNFDIQNEIKHLFYSKAIPIIDSSCSEISNPDQSHRIDQINLDIEIVDADNLKQKLISQIQEKFKEQLAQKISFYEKQNKDSRFTEIKKHRNYEIIAFFLNKGMLPWWAPEVTDIVALVKKTITEHPEDIKKIILDIAPNNNVMLARLIYQFPDDILNKIILLIRNDDGNILLDIYQKLYLSSDFAIKQSVSANKKETRFIVWFALFGKIFLNKEKQTNSANLFNELLAEISNNISINHKNAVFEKRISYQQQEEKFNDSQELYINNAGIVLIYPYLVYFFQQLNFLTANKTFIDVNKTKRAVLLLQYLGNGATENAENLLPLNKILCGLDMEESLDYEFELTSQELVECQALFDAIIASWNTSKKLSANWLRSAFFTREGVLSKQDDAWLLGIQSKDYDILLDKFVWPINVIKLPWMNTVLYVEWRNK